MKTFADLWEAQDSLQDAGVFVGMRGQKAHSDSYGTTVDFAALEQWKAEHEVTAEVQIMMDGANQQPPMKIVAAMLAI